MANRPFSLSFILLLLLALASPALGQVRPPSPRPPSPRPSPKPAPKPAVKPKVPQTGPQIKKPQVPTPPDRRLTKRMRDQRRGVNKGSSGSGSSGPAGPAAPGAPGAKRIPKAERDVADRRLASWKRSLRLARTERRSGVVRFLSGERKGEELQIRMDLARDSRGRLQARFRYEMVDGEPERSALMLLVDGRRAWWQRRPDKKEREEVAASEVGPHPGLLALLVPVEPGDGTLTYVGVEVHDGRRVLRFSRGSPDSSAILLRPDRYLVVKRETDSAVLEGRDEFRRGLHRRFKRQRLRDADGRAILELQWRKTDINPDFSADHFRLSSLDSKAKK